MKRKKFEKAIRVHEENLKCFAYELHELVDAMLEDGLSTADVIGILETEKLYRFEQVREEAKAESVLKMLGGMLDELEEQEEE